MNGLDVFLIILMSLVVFISIAASIAAIVDDEAFTIIPITLCMLFVNGLLLLPLIVLDRGSGATIGEITSVDKNFFGTTALYIKTSETTQEKYCIENSDVANQASELIGKKVKIYYGERVGIYSTGKCSQAPIDKIEEYN